VVVGTVSATAGSLGRGVVLAGPLLAWCVLLGVVVGELRVTAPPEGERTAVLETRRVRDYLPWRLATVVLTAAVLLAGLLVTTTALGSGDAMGRAGRTLFRGCSASTSEATGPWPGSFYSVPLAVVVGCGLLLAAVALRQVVRDRVRALTGCRRRAAPPRGRDRHRGRWAARRGAVRRGGPRRGCGPQLGVCAPVAWRGLGSILLLLVPVLLLVGAWCAGVLLGSSSPAAVRR
jgi:hypothetical protein